MSKNSGNNISTCGQVFLNVHSRVRNIKCTAVMSLTTGTSPNNMNVFGSTLPGHLFPPVSLFKTSCKFGHPLHLLNP